MLTKDEHKHLINTKIVQGKLSQLNLKFDDFIESIKKVKLINLSVSKLAVNKGLLQIPTEYKNLAIGASLFIRAFFFSKSLTKKKLLKSSFK